MARAAAFAAAAHAGQVRGNPERTRPPESHSRAPCLSSSEPLPQPKPPLPLPSPPPQVRRTGEAYVTHCVETGRIVAALLPSDSKRAVAAVVAAILHDVVDDTDTPLSEVQRAFGPEVASLVDGISRLSQINQLLRRRRRQAIAGQTAPVDSGWATVGGACGRRNR